jgi:S-adenosyl methyltransferase
VTVSWPEKWLEPDAEAPRDLDTTVPHSARIYDYWLGGKDNFAADREAAEAAIAANPLILPGVRANRAFLGRAVRYLAGEAGVRQILDVGTGLPSVSNTHQVAQAVAPECRVVYADNDPLVLVHAKALLTSTPEGATAYLDADLRDPETILRRASATLDFSRPVAVMLLSILHLVSDDAGPYQIVARLMRDLVPGSYLTISHPASDIEPEAMAGMLQGLNERVRVENQAIFRDRAAVCRYFDGLQMVEPGVVTPTRWRPDPGDVVPDREIPAWCGVARKTLLRGRAQLEPVEVAAAVDVRDSAYRGSPRLGW